MGEIANHIIDGECCAECNAYFEEGHGYPVLCKQCWSKVPKKDKKKDEDSETEITKDGYQKALNRRI